MQLKETIVGIVIATIGGTTTIVSATVGPVVAFVGLFVALHYALEPSSAK